MKLSNFIKGLQILQKYYNHGDGFHITAMADEFCAYATDKPMSDDDVKEMHNLGWVQPNHDFYTPYDPKEGWRVYFQPSAFWQRDNNEQR
jgi:hypothetical protein